MKRIVAAALLTLAGCTAPAPPPAAPNEATPAAGREQAPPVPPGQEQAALVRSTTAFALDLYRQLAPEEGNIFFSPAGIVTAFGMVHPGARGETAAEMEQALRWPRLGERLPSALGQLQRGFALAEDGRQVRVANRLWLQEGYPLRPEYRAIVTGNYGAAAEDLDFEQAGAAAARINRWAEEHSNGRIRNLLPPAGLRIDTRLVLTNLVWLEARWLIQFRAAATASRDFLADGVRAVPIPFMNQRAGFRHLDQAAFQAIELPYVGGELSMIVLLPKARDGLPALERGVDAERLDSWIDALRQSEPEQVELVLPKIELRTRYDLPPLLTALGMGRAFTDQADFSAMTAAERLRLDRAVHQTYLRVDEEGTEAAAATLISVVPVSAPPPVRHRFIADHPFLFLIRDNRSGAILFIGRFAAPE